MLYALICRDKPGALQVRLDTRAEHLAYIESTGVVKMAGPFLEDGQMCGSLVILETETLAAEAQHAIDLLQERRTALISAAVTGQIDVRDHVPAKAVA